MDIRVGSLAFERLRRSLMARRVQNTVALGLVFLAPLLVLSTILVLGPLDASLSSDALRLVLLADLVYVLLILGLVLLRLVRVIAARRAQSAGSRLHLRLAGVFTAMALVPTVTVAIFAGLTINVGLEGWFSDRVRQVVGASLAAARAYEAERTSGLINDTEILADRIASQRAQLYFMDDGTLRLILTQAQSEIQRGLREAFVIDGSGKIRARGERSYLFDYEKPSDADFNAARSTAPHVIQDWDNNEFRALMPLAGFADRYLYVSREVDGSILSLLDDTQKTAQFYQQLERERGRVLFEFGLLYLGFAVILVLAAVLMALWFAERLARPVGALAAAAQRVGQGDLSVRVPTTETDDEIGSLGKYFNGMITDIKLQRDRLLENTKQIESRRRLFDSVLSSVSSGVIGLDAQGKVSFANTSALRLLGLEQEPLGQILSDCVPEFSEFWLELSSAGPRGFQRQLRLMRAGRQEVLLLRGSARRDDDDALAGFVLTFDDVTDLVTAQRLAAWGDVARRIAHEIKNPLTPISLSADRIRRNFAPKLPDGGARLDELAQVIMRQTDDLRRIVDEFSKFARMPEVSRKPMDLVALVQEAVTLQEAGQPNIQFNTVLPDHPVTLDLDKTLMMQALTNLLKNAGEAIESMQEKTPNLRFDPVIHVAVAQLDGAWAVVIDDNGIGLPDDRGRLFEPYVTTRDKGTGLGLAIVKKIVEDHGGVLSLLDAPAMGGNPNAGARVQILFNSEGA